MRPHKLSIRALQKFQFQTKIFRHVIGEIDSIHLSRRPSLHVTMITLELDTSTRPQPSSRGLRVRLVPLPSCAQDRIST